MMADNVAAEMLRLNANLARRGMLFEDEQGEVSAFSKVVAWMKEDKDEAERIEQEAAAAEQSKPLETKEIFNPYRDKLKKEGRMR